MLAEAAACWPDLTARVLAQASRALDRDLSPWVEEATDARNEDLQLGVFLTSHIHLLAFERLELTPHASLGLSLGELNHVVDIGAIDFDDAVRLVSARGRAYDAGPSGTMAAVFPLEESALTPLLPDGVEIVGFNAPTQHVIAGADEPMRLALTRIDEATYARAVVLGARLPMHHSCFASVCQAYRIALEDVAWKQPRRAYRSNATSEVEPDPTAEHLVSSLARQVCSPVRWRTSIDRVASERDDLVFVEVGPGSVLVDLLRRRWRPEPRAGTAQMPEVEAVFRAA